MRVNQFDYDLPPERIAQTPVPRGESRLLVLRRDDGSIAHRRFSDLPDYLRAGDTLTLNDTRVSARRVQAVRENGHPAEALLLRPVGERCWEALVRPGRALKPGKELFFPTPDGETLTARVIASTAEGGRILECPDAAMRDRLARLGAAPLPPYIHTPLPPEQEERYQTVYAAHDGSAAAPTAGLHFTPELLAEIEAKGVGLARVTLNVGVGTFRPMRTETLAEHEMHGEWASLSPETAQQINATTGRVIAVGTTAVRTLESAAGSGADAAAGRVRPFSGETRLFITPGYRFRAIDGLVTNFHLPRSTLLVLVAAFAGHDATMRAYREAVQERYRFFSFGDAMLIL